MVTRRHDNFLSIDTTTCNVDRSPVIASLAMSENLHALPPGTLNTTQKRTHAKMEEALYSLPQTQYDVLIGASAAKRQRIDAASSAALTASE